MVLPSTIQGSNSVTQSEKPGDLTEEWPSLPGTCNPEIMHERMTISMPDSVPRVQNSEFEKKTCSPGGTLAGFQNSKIVQKESEPTMTTHQGTANWILIHNGEYKAWFYPSKGLNELFTQARKPTTPGIKAHISYNPKRMPQPPSTIHTQWRHTYAEVLTMEKGGENGWGRDAGRAEGGNRERSPVNGGMNLGSGNSGAMNLGNNNRARVDANQGRSNQFEYNLGYNRGRSYGGYARGWQWRPYGGYQYNGSHFHGYAGHGGGDAGRKAPHGHAAPAAPGNAALAAHGNAAPAIPHGNATPMQQQGAGGRPTQSKPQAPEVFKAQKPGKAKVDEGSSAKGKDKPFCFRCYKPGHGKLQCTTKLLCEICGNTDHLTGKCPILKQPWLLAHPCGYDVSGLGFYHIPHAPINIGKMRIEQH
jgi:hypothetical protein